MLLFQVSVNLVVTFRCSTIKQIYYDVLQRNIIIALEALAGFDQLRSNSATLQDGLEFALSGHDILASLLPDTCSQALPALHPKSHMSIT